MQVTECRVKLMRGDPGGNGRLLAFCSITLDDAFVVRDIKIIGGAAGRFIAMPDRKLTDRCGDCGNKNHLRSRFCGQCGCRLDEDRAFRDGGTKAKLHADTAHPVTPGCRAAIQAAVLDAYADELERSSEPGYVPRYVDWDRDYDEPGRGLQVA